MRVKIVEEALELASSGDPEEAADLLEALYEWLWVRGVGVGFVEGLRRGKRARLGGFSGGFVLFDSC